MPETENPYIPGQPVDAPEGFFGRRQVIGSICEQLLRGRRSFVVSGPRRIGRTSLLRRLAGDLPQGFLPAVIELGAFSAQRLDWLLWRLAQTVMQRLAGQGEPVTLSASWADFDGAPGFFLDRFWPEAGLLLGDDCLVVMLDDVHSLEGESVHLLEPFLSFLTRWRNQEPRLALVLTTIPAWQERLLREVPGLLGGSLSYALGPLSSDEATRLITRPVDGILTYDYGLVRRLIEMTSGHPYYLQLVCSEVFSRCVASRWVGQRDVDLVLEDLIGRELPEFRQVWDESSPREQAVLAVLVSLRGARGVATAQEVRNLLVQAGARMERGQTAPILEGLAARGILEKLGAQSFRFRVGLLRDWLAKRVDLEEVVRHSRWEATDRAPGTGKQRVAKLPVARGPRRPAAREQGATGEEDQGQEEEGRAFFRPGLGLGLGLVAVAVVILVLAVSLGRGLLPGFGSQPTPTATLSVSQAARLSPATRTPAPQTATVEGTPGIATLPSATASPRPEPTLTPSPTPPLVVARPVPAIAFLSRQRSGDPWSVYLISSDGAGLERLTEGDAEFLSSPAWSPDGKRIAFVSARDGAADIWATDLDGSNMVNLTRHQAKDHSPAWSPDGEWIAFASVRDSLYWELYLMGADGSHVQRLTWWEGASDLWPTWSPDGTRLAFASRRDGNWELYTIDRDGSNLRRLTNHPADDTTPAWSPDGSRIAFESTRDGYAEIYVVPATGGEAVNISNLAWATDRGPTWSPDGSRIAFYSDRDGQWDIYVMPSAGGEAVRLTSSSADDQLPAWRP
jgi:hypothetical protein